jgi:hypothetical protein
MGFGPLSPETRRGNAEGATQMMIVQTYDAAEKAGCVKPN